MLNHFFCYNYFSKIVLKKYKPFNWFVFLWICIWNINVFADVPVSAAVPVNSLKNLNSDLKSTKLIPLNWKESMRMIEENNFEMRSAREDLRKAKLTEQTAFSGFLPKLSVNLSQDQIFKPGYETVDNSYESYLKFEQNLFSGFYDQYKYKQALIGTVAAEEAFKAINAKLTADLKQTIAQWMYASEVVRLSEKILERRKENIKNVQIRFKGGAEHLGSLKMAEAYLMSSKVDLLSAEKNLEIAKSNVKAILGLTNEVDITWSGDLPPYKIIEPTDIEKLAKETAEYKKSLSEEKATSLDVEIAKSKFYPSLDFVAKTGTVDDHFFPEKNKWSVGLNLSWELYSGQKDNVDLQLARSKRLVSQVELQTKTQTIISKILTAHANLILAIEKIKVEERFKDATQLRAEIAEKKYINGIISFDDWDGIENDLIDHEKSVLSSYLERRIYESNLESLLGQGVW